MAENLPHRAAPGAFMAAVEWTGEMPDRLRAVFPELAFQSYLEQHWIECVPAVVPAVIQHLHGVERFDMLTDLTVVDRPQEPERFEVVYILYSFPRNTRIRVKARTPSEVPSVSAIYPGANWLEREAFDMFGVRFTGHPNLKRILMPDDWDGHPLRKEKSIIDMDNDWVQRNLGIESGQS